MWRRRKLYVTDLRDGSGRAVNGGDVHTFYVTDHLRDGLRNHSTTCSALGAVTPTTICFRLSNTVTTAVTVADPPLAVPEVE